MMLQKKTITVLVALWALSTMVYYDGFSFLQGYKYRKYTYSKGLYNLYKFLRIPDLTSSNLTYFESGDFYLNTSGCYIPNYSKTLIFKEAKRHTVNCPKQVVFVKQISDHEITFHIERNAIKVGGDKLKCCYSFVKRSMLPGYEDARITYSQCKPFENGHKAVLEEETITVSCVLLKKNKRVFIHNDAYLILKKKLIPELKEPTKELVSESKKNWNVIIVGVDTMSRARAYSSMPKTVKYLRNHNWLDYRGLNKVGYNTFPNMMALLTGMNDSRAYHICSGGMENCKHSLIWNKFKEAGYATAYGEDNLRLPDTFAPYQGFNSQPTDHYARPFFLTGERQTGNHICAGSKPSSQHLLEYAGQFAQAYKNNSFFGHFWINSCAHNLEYLPTLCENYFIDFLDSLKNTGVLKNTFVFVMSDHGIRYGLMREPWESYYEERLPLMFMWVPPAFRQAYPTEYYNLKLNQFRLTTPYDVHITLWKLMNMTNRGVDTVTAEGCPECQGLLKEIPEKRTCKDAHIAEKWCACHNMIPSKNYTAVNNSLHLAVTNIQEKVLSVKTIPCNICSPLSLKSVLRSHQYTHDNKTYYIVAFVLGPGDVGFEAIVEHSGNYFKILKPIETISSYNVRGNCVVNNNDRSYCVCELVKGCKSNKKKSKL